MRISDWSSDVCSSDLQAFDLDAQALRVAAGVDQRSPQRQKFALGVDQFDVAVAAAVVGVLRFAQRLGCARQDVVAQGLRFVERSAKFAMQLIQGGQIGRATSELQSLMRISYAVFCLK